MEDLIKVTKIVNLKTMMIGEAIEDNIIESTLTFITPSQVLKEFEADLTPAQKERMLHKEKLYKEISLSTFKVMTDEKLIELHRQIYEIEK
jgi:hypothetical protein